MSRYGLTAPALLTRLWLVRYRSFLAPHPTSPLIGVCKHHHTTCDCSLSKQTVECKQPRMPVSAFPTLAMLSVALVGEEFACPGRQGREDVALR